MESDALEKLLRRAFILGHLATREGFNGECGYDHCAPDRVLEALDRFELDPGAGPLGPGKTIPAGAPELESFIAAIKPGSALQTLMDEAMQILEVPRGV